MFLTGVTRVCLCFFTNEKKIRSLLFKGAATKKVNILLHSA